MNRRAQGFSLLELVVVLAIFALVALIGVQVIRSTVMTDRRLAAVSEANAELAVAMALLRRDMRAVIAVPFFTVTGVGEPPLRIGPGSLGLSVGGLAGVEASGPGLGRVIWRHDPATGRLLRKVWTTLSPGSTQAGGPEVVMLSDVAGLSVESFTVNAGWQRGYAPDPRTPDALPLALRVRLQHDRFEQVETLVTLR